MPNGYEEQFNKKLAEWEAQTKLFVEQAGTAQTQLEDLTKQLTEASAQFIPPSEPPKMIGPVEFVSPAMSELLKKAEYAITVAPEIQSIKDEITIISADLERYDFFARLYNEVPAAIAAGAVSSANDVLTKLSPPGDLTAAELEEVKSTISEMVAVITGERPEIAPESVEELPEGAVYPELIAPSIPSITPVGIHLLSTQELVKALKAPVIPEGTISEEDWREYLREQGWSEEDIDKEQQYDAEQLIQDWEERNNRMEAYRAGLAEMPDYTAADMLKELAVQPGLFLMEMAGYYFEHVTMPLAGTIYGAFIPDIQKEYIAYKKANPQAPYWEGISHAWRAWDAPMGGAAEWILKYVLMEGLVDPLTYVGWGIYTRLTRPLGSFGKLVAMLERGAMEVLEMPFDLVKAIWHGLPKTLTQRATMFTARGTALVKRYVTAASRRPLSFIGMDDLTDVVQRGINYTLAHPQVDDTIAVAGREMLRHAPVDDTLVRRWSTALGTTLGPDDITRVTVQNVDDLFEDYFWRGAVGREIITQDEAARQLLGILHVQNTSDDILKAAGSLLNRRSETIIKAAGAFTAKSNPLAAMRALSRKNLGTYTAIEKSAAALARRDAGRFSTFLYGVSERLQAVWVNKIDKYLVRPTAEAYLTFGMYGPMNVLEDFWRSALGGVFPRRATIEDIQMVGTGLVYDVNLERAGLSEMMGPTRRLGAESTWNNWILQVGGLADNWGEKLYKALVEVPGGVGMDVRRNFILRKYMQILGETGGDTVQALLKLKTTLPDLADTKIVRELQATTQRAALTGRLHTSNADFVDMIKGRFTRKKIVRNEVNTILKEHPDVSNVVRDHVMRNYDSGTLLRTADDIERVVGKESRDLALDEFIRGPEMAVENFRQLKDFLIDLNVRNPEEMATAIQAVYKMSEVYGALPEQVVAQATIRSRGLPLAERRATFEADFDRIAMFLDRAGVSVDDVITNLKKRAVDLGLPDNYSDAAGRLFDIMTTKREYAAEFRAQNMATRSEIFRGATPTQLKTSEFWDDFYTRMGSDYHILNTRMAELDALMANAIESLNTAAGVRLPSRAPVVIKGRPLAAQDVAQLMGVRGDDISRALLDVLTVQNNKDFFVAYVMGKVRPGVDIGFTKEAVAAVYDQIAYSLKVSPQAMSWISGQQLEIDAMRKEFHSLLNSKLLPDNEIAAIGRYIDDMAEQVERLMYKDGKLVPSFVKYDDLRQSAMDEAHKWYYKEYPDYTNANAFDAMMKTVYPYWCTPEYATALTRDGWKHYSELRLGEDLLTVNPETLVTEWQPLQNLAVFDYDDELMVVPAKGKDIEFTPNHRWLVINKHSDVPHIKRGYELTDQYDLIPRALGHNFPEDSVLSPRDAAILGWVVSDGYYQRRNGTLNSLIIYQSEKKYLDEIVALTGGSAYPRVSGSTDWIVRVKLEDRDRISSICCCAEDVISVVSRLSREAAEAMWDAMFKGEGNSDNGWRRFKQNPGIVKEAFELLSVLLGKSITSGKKTVYMTGNGKPLQAKEVRRLRTKHYKGKVWCPVTPNGTWIMNCNGSIVPTGNTYESQRWFWLPRSFVRHPGTFTAFERWQNNSDYGYIHIPGTSIDINPFRGTIYGAMTTRLTRRDFPEYYDSLGGAKGLVEFSDFLSRFGFYPGAHIGVPLALMGGLEQQMGETIPAIWKTPLNALIAIAPESEAVKWISDHLFSDRFRDYLTILQVNRRGYNGSHLWSKVRENIALTEEEQTIWDESRGEAAAYSTLFEQTGLFRLRTEEQYEAYEQSATIIEELTGYTKDQQDWLRRHGYRIWDVVGGLSPTHQAILQEMETYKWIGTVTPLLPSRQQAELRRLDLDWDEVLQYTESNQSKKLQLEQDLLAGKLGPRDYNDRLQSLYIDQRNYIDKKVKANPNMTLEGRLDYYKKYQVPIPVQHPMRELLNLYFSIELEDIYDKETGELRADWDTFFARRAAIEAAIPESITQEWESYMSRNSTKMEKVRRDVYDKYFRKYYNVWDKVLSTYPDEEQTLINEYLYLERTGQKLERQAAIKALISAKTGNMLISSFRSEVSVNRKALRYANPILDAWLFYWGRVTSFVTPQAEAIYHQLAKDTGRTIG